MQQGDFGTQARLRRRDNLQSLATAFNEMIRGLQRQTRADQEQLRAAIATARRIDNPEVAEVVSTLERLVVETRRRIQEGETPIRKAPPGQAADPPVASFAPTNRG